MKEIKKIVITGATGMLGNSIIEEFIKDKYFEVYGVSRSKSINSNKYKHLSLDLTNFDLLKQTLKEIEPDIIIHCAAMVNVDSCEENKESAYNLHVKSTEILASYKPESTKFIYISTDSVYDGCLGDYSEMHNTNPLNIYAKTKAQGEEIALDINPNTIVIRTNIYGFHIPKSNSLAEWAIENLSNGNSINGFTDVYFNPVYVGQLAEIINTLCNRTTKFTGILNVGSTEYVSKYEFLNKLAKEFNYHENLVSKMSIENIKFNALRPKNTTLNIDKLNKLYNKIPTIEVGLEIMKKDMERIRRYELGKNK